MRRRWRSVVAAGVALATLIGGWAPEWHDSPEVPFGHSASGSCLLRSVALAQEGGGLDLDVTNIFGDGCFEVRITGVCPCPRPPYVCVRITYWEPRLLIVTEQGPAHKAHGQLGQQFGEATAYPFPVGAVMEVLGFDFLCTPSELRGLSSLSAAAAYSSRLDEGTWRTGGLETVLAEATAPGANPGAAWRSPPSTSARPRATR